jgi:hypothetical protein
MSDMIAETIEKTNSVERESKQKVAIVVLGRGVGVKTGSNLEEVRAGRGDLIEPTDYLESAVIKDFSKGNFGPEEHPEFNETVDIHHEPKNSRYAGASANVEATKVLVDMLAKDPGRKLEAIYFAAGRIPEMEGTVEKPGYAPKGWTQGMVLAKNLLKNGVEEQLRSDGVKMVFEPNNVNTWDDIVASLKHAQESGYDEVYVVTVAPHLERTDLMVREAIKGMQQMYGEDDVFDVRMIPSELMLINDNEQFKKMSEAMFRDGRKSGRRTIGLRVTEQREQNGMKARKAGTYKSQWEDGGMIHDFNKPVQVMSVEEVVKFR